MALVGLRTNLRTVSLSPWILEGGTSAIPAANILENPEKNIDTVMIGT